MQLFGRNINNIHNYNEKGFLYVVNLFNEARNTISNSGKGSMSFRSTDYRFSRVYLLWFSKGQSGPRDIDLNNNNIGRRVHIDVLLFENSYRFQFPFEFCELKVCRHAPYIILPYESLEGSNNNNKSQQRNNNLSRNNEIHLISRDYEIIMS